MPRIKLTDKFCAAAKAETGLKIDYFDELTAGLCLRVSQQGAKTWYAVYSRPGGKRGWLKLGTYPETPLAKARKKAKNERGNAQDGRDPITEKRAEAAAMTVADLADSYIERHVARLRSGDEKARRLRKDVVPLIGDVKLSALHRRDITRCIDAVADRGAPRAAAHVFEDLRSMIRWAVARGDLDANPMAVMTKPKTSERDRVLSAEEIKAVWAALPRAEMRESTRRILRLCLILGQRVGEISGMTRTELDLDRAVWTIPAARVKNNTEHFVPLPAMAREIIQDQLAAVDKLCERKEREPSDFLFPAPGGQEAVTARSIAHAVRTKDGGWGIPPWTPHDCRRTVATGMAELGVAPHIIGAVLNHRTVTRSSVTTRHYIRHSYEPEKRSALESWSAHLAAIIEGRDNVVPFGGARASAETMIA